MATPQMTTGTPASSTPSGPAASSRVTWSVCGSGSSSSLGGGLPSCCATAVSTMSRRRLHDLAGHHRREEQHPRGHDGEDPGEQHRLAPGDLLEVGDEPARRPARPDGRGRSPSPVGPTGWSERAPATRWSGSSCAGRDGAARLGRPVSVFAGAALNRDRRRVGASRRASTSASASASVSVFPRRSRRLRRGRPGPASRQRLALRLVLRGPLLLRGVALSHTLRPSPKVGLRHRSRSRSLRWRSAASRHGDEPNVTPGNPATHPLVHRDAGGHPGVQRTGRPELADRHHEGRGGPGLRVTDPAPPGRTAGRRPRAPRPARAGRRRERCRRRGSAGPRRGPTRRARRSWRGGAGAGTAR